MAPHRVVACQRRARKPSIQSVDAATTKITKAVRARRN